MECCACALLFPLPSWVSGHRPLGLSKGTLGVCTGVSMYGLCVCMYVQSVSTYGCAMASFPERQIGCKLKWGRSQPPTPACPSPGMVLTIECDECLQGSVRRTLSTIQIKICCCCKLGLLQVSYRSCNFCFSGNPT